MPRECDEPDHPAAERAALRVQYLKIRIGGSVRRWIDPLAEVRRKHRVLCAGKVQFEVVNRRAQVRIRRSAVSTGHLYGLALLQ